MPRTRVSKVSSVPRKKVDSRPPDKGPDKERPEKFFCTRCGKAFPKQRGNFTISHSPLFCGNDYYVPVCNRCVDELYAYYVDSLGSHKEAMKRICQKFDFYWSEVIYSMIRKTSTTMATFSRVREYASRVNIASQTGKTFDNTLDEENEARELKEEEDRKEREELEEELKKAKANMIILPDGDGSAVPVYSTNELTQKWGAGFPDDMYVQLEGRYKYWTGESDEDLTREEKALYIQISQMEVLIQRAAARGDSVDKYVNTLNSLLGSANLKPSQKKEEDTEFDDLPLGVGIKIYEDARPIPKPLPELEDCDHLVKYISVWFLGHLQKMLGIKGRYNKMYSEEIEKLRVRRPELAEEDEEELIVDIFGETKNEQ